MTKIYLKVREAIEQHQNQFPADERPSQAKIAIECGINPVTLSRYITGKVERPDLAVVAKLCDYLGIEDMNDIFRLEREDNA